MTSDQLAAYLASFPKGTPILINEGTGDIMLNCEPVELFIPIGPAKKKNLQYLVIELPIKRNEKDR